MSTEKQLKFGLRLSMLQGALATLPVKLTMGMFLSGYALLIGANYLEIGIITSIPYLAQVFQIPGAWYLQTRGRRKFVAISAAVIGRTFWFPIAFLLFIPELGDHVVIVFIVLFLISGIFMQVSTNAQMLWMGAFVPPDIRGRFFGKRNFIIGVMTILVSYGAGVLLDYYDSSGQQAAGFAILFVLVAVVAYVNNCLTLFLPEPKLTVKRSLRLFEQLKKPFRSEPFRRLVYFIFGWTFMAGLASPFFPVYMLEYVGWNFSTVAVYTVIATSLTAVLQAPWGMLLDRYGHKPILLTTIIGLIFIPVFWLFITPEFPYWLWADSVLMSVLWSGFILASFSIVLYSLPKEGRAMHLAMFATIVGIANFLSMVLGGFLAEILVPYSVKIFNIRIINFHYLFLLTAAGRFGVFFLARRIIEPEAKGPRVMIMMVYNTIARRIGMGRQFWLLGGEQDNDHFDESADKNGV